MESPFKEFWAEGNKTSVLRFMLSFENYLRALVPSLTFSFSAITSILVNLDCFRPCFPNDAYCRCPWKALCRISFMTVACFPIFSPQALNRPVPTRWNVDSCKRPKPRPFPRPMPLPTIWIIPETSGMCYTVVLSCGSSVECNHKPYGACRIRHEAFDFLCTVNIFWPWFHVWIHVYSRIRNWLVQCVQKEKKKKKKKKEEKKTKWDSKKTKRKKAFLPPISQQP